MTPQSLQLIFTDCRTAKRLLIRMPNGHGFIGLVKPETTADSPEVRAIVRRLARRKAIA